MLLRLVLFALLVNCKGELQNYQLIFPLEASTPYAKLFGTVPSSLTDMSVCYWTRPRRNAACESLFSYSVPRSLRNIVIKICAGGEKSYFERQQINVDGDSSQVLLGKQSLQKFSWIHSCVTWSALEGRWQYYLNGVKYNEGTSLVTGELIPPYGVVILGRDLETSDEKDQLRGQVSDLHLWDFILPSDDIFKLSSCQLEYEGNVIGWHSATWEMYNGTRVAPVRLPCIKQR